MFCLLLAKSLIAAFWAMNFPRALNLLHASCLQGFGTKFWKLQQYVQHAFNFLTEIVCSMTVASFLIFHVDGTCRVLQQKKFFARVFKYYQAWPFHCCIRSGTGNCLVARTCSVYRCCLMLDFVLSFWSFSFLNPVIRALYSCISRICSVLFFRSVLEKGLERWRRASSPCVWPRLAVVVAIFSFLARGAGCWKLGVCSVVFPCDFAFAMYMERG